MSEESGARRLTTWPQDGVPRRTTSASEHALLTARSISSTDKAEDDAEGMSPIKGVRLISQRWRRHWLPLPPGRPAALARRRATLPNRLSTQRKAHHHP